MHFNSKKVVLKRDVLSQLRRIFSKQGGKRRFPNYPLKNYGEKQVVLKSSSTKRNDSYKIIGKNYEVGFKI